MSFLLPKISSPYETAVMFHAPDAPGVDYTLSRVATHDLLDFGATFALYPTYCLPPAAMKPSKGDRRGRPAKSLFVLPWLAWLRNAKTMWERHTREHWDKGGRQISHVVLRLMWLSIPHSPVLLPLSPRPISPPARQDPAVIVLKLCFTFISVCLPTLHASTTPRPSSQRKNKLRKTGALPCPIPTRTWNRFTPTRKTSRSTVSVSAQVKRKPVLHNPPSPARYPTRSHSRYARRPSRARATVRTPQHPHSVRLPRTPI